jgi:hypothetical protein
MMMGYPSKHVGPHLMKFKVSNFNRNKSGVPCVGFWWGDLREGDHLGDSGVDGRILKWIFKKWDGGASTGLSCLRIGTGVGLL